MKWKSKCSYAAALILAFGITLPGSPAIAAKECSLAAIQAITPAGTNIDKVELVQTPVPNCRIDGHIITTNPGPDKVSFRLQLPMEGWNKRYYFIALGGSAGYVPTESTSPPGNPVSKGYAVAGTDTGEHETGSNFSLFNNEAKALDFVQRGAHVTAVSTQAITKAFYGADKMYRYMSGCSNGGRMGLTAGTTYPDDFDGLLVGAPGLGPRSVLGYIWAAQAVLRDPASWVPPAKLALIERSVDKACGDAGGVVWDPYACHFNPAKLLCKSGDAENCLTAPQVAAVKKILAGPHDAHGRQLYPGWPISNTTFWANTHSGYTPPAGAQLGTPSAAGAGKMDPDTGLPVEKTLPPYGTIVARSVTQVDFGNGYDFLHQFDFDNAHDIDVLLKGLNRKGPLMVDDPRFQLTFRPFEAKGGKMIVWHGASDANVSYLDTIRYFYHLRSQASSPAAFDAMARLYIVPGVLHCRGGTGPTDADARTFDALVDWVEKGKAPGALVTHRTPPASPPKAAKYLPELANLPPREFLLCPYPQKAVFKGPKGAEDKAANWSCGPK